jgi:hypothetical protein
MIKKILIGLSLSTSLYAMGMPEKYRSVEGLARHDFVVLKAVECEDDFNRTRRQKLEDRFCMDTIHEMNTKHLSMEDIVYSIKEFNERLFDDLLAFAAAKYKYEPYVTRLIFCIGEVKIKDRLFERLFNDFVLVK